MNGRQFTLRGGGRVALEVVAQPLGDDLVVSVTGGDRPHIGAVALAGPGTRPTGTVPESGLVLGLPGHRDADLAGPLAERLAAEQGCAVAVVVGVHLEGATRAEIAAVLALAAEIPAALRSGEWRQVPDGDFS